MVSTLEIDTTTNFVLSACKSKPNPMPFPLPKPKFLVALLCVGYG